MRTFLAFLLVYFPASCTDLRCSNQSTPSDVRESIVVDVGETVELHCTSCFLHQYDNLTITWHYRRETEAEDEELDGTGRRILRLLSIREDKSGLYWCRLVTANNTTYVSPVYEVSVTGNTAKRNILYRISASSANFCTKTSEVNSRNTQEETTVKLHGEAGKMFTEWSEWSSCSVPFCKLGDICGYRRRIGTCYVHFDSMKDVKIGRPCRSKFLPTEMAQLAKNRVDEIEYNLCVAYRCMMDLKQRNPYSMSRQYFKFDESDLQSIRKGHRSSIMEMVDGVMRGTQFQVKFPSVSQRLTIACGKILSRSKSIVWLRRQQIIVPLLDSTKIDVLNRLVFEKIRDADTDIYSCWEEEALVGIYVVLVLESFDYERDVKQVLFFLALLITLIVLVRLVIFPWRLYIERLRYSQY